MMTLSGFCAIAIGVVFDGPLWLFLLIAVLWGITVIGDSAQFSAMATELSNSSYVGTALALQLGLGFLLTLVSIRLTSMLAAHIGWRWSFLPLAFGPVVGVVAMLLLHGRIATGARATAGPPPAAKDDNKKTKAKAGPPLREG
jgi:MFS family permease